MWKLISLLALVWLLTGAQFATAQDDETVLVQIEFQAVQHIDGERIPLPRLAATIQALGMVRGARHDLVQPVAFTTDEAGTGYANLSLSAAERAQWIAKSEHIVVRVDDPRFTNQDLNVHLRPHGQNPYTATLRPKPGGTVRGRVVSDSSSTATAVVYLMGPDLASPIRAIVAKSGEFAVHYEHPGDYEVSVTYQSHRYLRPLNKWWELIPPMPRYTPPRGAARSGPLHLTGGLHSEFIVLEQAGDAFIAGRLIDANGDGIADVVMRAKWSSQPRDANSPRNKVGLEFCKATTDADGAFRFDRLRPGTFIITYAYEPERLRYAQLATDQEPATLTCTLPRLALSVLDATGAPLRMHEDLGSGSEYFQGRYQVAELDTEGKSLLRPPGSLWGYREFGLRLFTRGSFEHSFIVQPDHDYRVLLLPTGGPPMIRTVHCSEPVTKVQFQKPKREQLGLLKVNLDDVFPEAYNSEYALSIRRNSDQLLVHGEAFRGPTTELLLEPGEYTVIVRDRFETNPAAIKNRTRVESGRPLFTHEQVVQIDPGDDTLIHVMPKHHGRLVLTLSPLRSLDKTPPLQSIVVTASGIDSKIPLRWIVPYSTSSDTPFDTWPICTALETLPPGEYELNINIKGLPPIRRPFPIVAGEISHVKASL